MASSRQRPLAAQPGHLQRRLEPALDAGLEQGLLLDAQQVSVLPIHPAEQFDRIGRSSHEATVPKPTRLRDLDRELTEALANMRERFNH